MLRPFGKVGVTGFPLRKRYSEIQPLFEATEYPSQPERSTPNHWPSVWNNRPARTQLLCSYPRRKSIGLVDRYSCSYPRRKSIGLVDRYSFSLHVPATLKQSRAKQFADDRIPCFTVVETSLQSKPQTSRLYMSLWPHNGSTCMFAPELTPRRGVCNFARVIGLVPFVHWTVAAVALVL